MNDNFDYVAQTLGEGKTDLDQKWLTFWMDRQLFGVSIANVEQIVSMQPITEVPEYPMYAKGIINLRGNIIPVIDLRMRLGKMEIPYDDHTCIIITNVMEKQIGFIVDEVDAVLDVSDEQITPPPQMGGDTANRYLTGVARLSREGDAGEKIMLCIDTAKVLYEGDLYVLDNM